MPYRSTMRIYRRIRHRLICWTRAWLFEIGMLMVIVGLILWGMAKPWQSGGEPKIILAMSALALVFSGLTTIAVAATDDN